MENSAALINGTSVVFAQGNSVDFGVEILKVVQAGEIVIVVPIRPPSIDNSNNNVYSFSIKGDFLWRLETKGTEFDRHTTPSECKFVDASFRPDGDLILFNWCDFAFRVNPDDGHILERFESR